MYDLIVIDPPWPVKKLTHKSRPKQVDMDYKVMSLQDITDLPISRLAEEKCWCFLWTTQKHLFAAKPMLELWGFNYLLTMTWEKTYGRSAGMPLYGFRWNVEFILVGRKGQAEVWPKRKLIPAAFSAENIKHSQKPDRFYEFVEPLGERRLDMFARKERAGWDVFGDEVSNSITL